MSGSDVPAFMHDRNQLKSLPRDIRLSLQETVSALLIQVPNIVRLYEKLLRNLEEITVELGSLGTVILFNFSCAVLWGIGCHYTGALWGPLLHYCFVAVTVR